MRASTPRKEFVPRGYDVVTRASLPIDAAALARELLGAFVVRAPIAASDETCIARIVETEAYVPGDAACHAFGGKTVRNASLFGARGRAYVYFIYGMYFCFNVSAERDGIGAGVLVRAAEPIAGFATMRRRRNDVCDRDLLRGPGRFALAMGIDRAIDGAGLCAEDRTSHSTIVLARDAASGANSRYVGEEEIATGPRIGISKEAARPLRFYLRQNNFVSGTRRQNDSGSTPFT